MDRASWGKQTDNATATARAFGRNRLNAQRRRKMWQRRFALLAIVRQYETVPRGFQSQMATKFGVTRCVISKDMKWVLANLMEGLEKVTCSLRGCQVTVTAENPLPYWMRNQREWMRFAKRIGLL